MNESEKIFQNIIRESLFHDGDVNHMNHFLEALSKYHKRNAHNLQEIRNRDDKKIHGDIFEEFAKVYMRKHMKISNVWLLREIPEPILEYLSLKSHDVGIDLVGLDDDGRFFAIQAKYKNRCFTSNKKVSVTWKEISTFFALCARTGPYHKYIVITTADYVRHMAPKTPQDKSVCLGSLRKLTRDVFRSFIPSIKHEESASYIIEKQNEELEEAMKIDSSLSEKDTLTEQQTVEKKIVISGDTSSMNTSLEHIRQARIVYFEKMYPLSKEYCEN